MNQLYHDIFMKIAPYLPEKWDKVVFMANYGDWTYSFALYLKINNEFVSISSLGFSREDIRKLYRSINQIIEPIYSQLNQDELWYTMTLCLDFDGRFKVDYDYEDVGDHFTEYIDAWRAKYLI